MITSTVRRTVRERGLVSRGDHVLVACSGGPDSTALLHVLHRLRTELGITLCVASIDHGLRPESAAEVEQVSALASDLGLSFYRARIEVTTQGPSIQGRARELRYAALQELARAHGATCIAVGHSQDDQAETVLARILRGTGIRGLEAIEPRRADGVIRPLLDCRRSELRAYVLERGLSFIDDPSNHQRDFERVRIRHEVLPVLLAEDFSLVEHLSAIGEEAAEINAYLDAQLPEVPPRGARTIAVEALADLAAPIRIRWLRRWIAQETGLTPNRSHLVEIGRLLTGRGEVLLGSDWSVRRQSGGLSLEYREHRRTRSNRS
ncbi:MAG: tRNA lysidine(34) synthetase TilS [Myxococcales bacterium]|nr:tRNA lysidine(34) synthetase TilS [Myxococcales bacterium]